jgi:hypothetical protein
LVKRFFKIYRARCDAIFSDQGNSFFGKEGSTLTGIGFKTHRGYPPCVHQYLSPNDNRLHGVAKSKWQLTKLAYGDDIESSLSLLHYLDEVSQRQQREWCNRNFSLVNKQEAEAFINGDQLDRSIYFNQCKDAYIRKVRNPTKRNEGHLT